MMVLPKNQFPILALAPFGLVPESAARIRLVTAQPDSLDHAVADIKPSLYLPVSLDLCPAGGLELALESMKGFQPDLIVRKNAYLNTLLEAKNYLADALAKGASENDIAARLRQFPNLPLDLTAAPARPAPAAKSSPVDDILSLVATPGSSSGAGSGGAGAKDWLGQLEAALAELLSHVFSSPEFRRYESSWRGLALAARQAGSALVPLTIGNISLELLEQGLDELQEQIINDPPALIVVDHAFDNSQRSMEMLERLAKLGETLLTPVVTSIDQRFFGLESWDGLHKLPYLPHLLDEAPWAKWRRLRKQDAANWLAVTANRLLARDRYGKDNPARPVAFEEPYEPWIGSAWGLTALMVKRFAETGWASRAADAQVAQLTGLPLAKVPDEPPRAAEADFSAERVHQFGEIGIMPVIAPARKDIAFIPKDITPAGAPLSYQLILSRIITLVLWAKEQLGADMGADALEAELTTILTQFFDVTGPETPADLAVSVQEDPGRPHLVSITLTPPAKILPTGQKVELSLPW